MRTEQVIKVDVTTTTTRVLPRTTFAGISIIRTQDQNIRHNIAYRLRVHRGPLSLVFRRFVCTRVLEKDRGHQTLGVHRCTYLHIAMPTMTYVHVQ